MFVIVPLTIPAMIIYVIFRYPQVSMPILGVIGLLGALTIVIALPPVVGIPILSGLGLVGLWWLRIRLNDNRGRHSYVEPD